MIQFLSLF